MVYHQYIRIKNMIGPITVPHFTPDLTGMIEHVPSSTLCLDIYAYTYVRQPYICTINVLNISCANDKIYIVSCLNKNKAFVKK